MFDGSRQDRANTLINFGTSVGVVLSGPVALVAAGQWRLAWAVFAAVGLAVMVWNLLVMPAGNPGNTREPSEGAGGQELAEPAMKPEGLSGIWSPKAASWARRASTTFWVVLGVSRLLGGAAGDLVSIPGDIYGTDYETEDGTAVRDYIHVEDLGRAHLRALEASGEGEHRIYNLGNGAGFSVRQVIETAREVTGVDVKAVEAPQRAGDPPVLVASSALIQDELGWKPEKSGLATMIFDAWEWKQSHPRGYE